VLLFTGGITISLFSSATKSWYCVNDKVNVLIVIVSGAATAVAAVIVIKPTIANNIIIIINDNDVSSHISTSITNK
jgi:deoxyxylulose-5-phosphate synthase